MRLRSLVTVACLFGVAIPSASWAQVLVYDGLNPSNGNMFAVANSALDSTGFPVAVNSFFDGSKTTTAILVDDLQLDGSNTYQYLTSLQFKITNQGIAPITISANIRFYDDDLKFAEDPAPDVSGPLFAPGSVLKTALGTDAVFDANGPLANIVLPGRGANDYSTTFASFTIPNGGVDLLSEAAPGRPKHLFLGFTFETAGDHVDEMNQVGLLVDGSGPTVGSNIDSFYNTLSDDELPNSYSSSDPFGTAASNYFGPTTHRYFFDGYQVGPNNATPIAAFAFRLYGSAAANPVAPEPGSVALFTVTALPMIGLAVRRRRAR